MRAVSSASALGADDDRDQLGLVVDEHVDERDRGVGWPTSPPRWMPSRVMAIQSPVAIGAALGDAVAHRLGDLAGPHAAGRLCHRRAVRVERRVGVVGHQRAERLDHRRGGHHRHRDVGEPGHLLAPPARCSCCSAARSRRRRRTRSTASRICAVDGFIDCPPADDLLHAEAAQEGAQPVADRDRDHRGGDVLDRRAAAGVWSRTHASSSRSADLLEQVGDADVARAGPTAMPASMAAPMSSVCTWQFHRPSPPTTTIESPRRAPRRLEAGRCGVVGRVEEVHHLVAEVADVTSRVAVAGVRPDRDVGVHRLGGRERAPSTTT